MKHIFVILFAVAALTGSASAQRYHAILFCGWAGPGDYRDSFWNDTFKCYKMFREKGYSDDDITVFFNDGNDEARPDPEYQAQTYQYLNRLGLPQITDYEAHETIFANFLSLVLKPQMTDKDVYILYVLGHGVPTPSFSTSDPNSISDRELVKFLKDIPYRKRIILMQQCSSGGFIPALANNKTIILTSVEQGQVAIEADDVQPDGNDAFENEFLNRTQAYRHGEFDYHVMNALSGLTIAESNDIRKDVDQRDIADGHGSLHEAMQWELFKDIHAHNPSFSYDQQLASRTFLRPAIDLAHNQVSLEEAPLMYNNQRKLVAADGQELHEVFDSEGEIIYRRSPDAGTTWEITRQLDDILFSADNIADAPCLHRYTNGTILAVWQERNTTWYTIRFARSTDNGLSWKNLPYDSPKIYPFDISPSPFQIAIGSSARPTPVIAGIDNGFAVIVYTDGGALRYSVSDDFGETWRPVDIIPDTTPLGTNFLSNYHRPTVCAYHTFWGTSMAALAFTADYSGMHHTLFCTYDAGTSQWSLMDPVSIGTPYIDHGSPSLSISAEEAQGYKTLHLAWHAMDPSTFTQKVLYRSGILNSITSPFTEFNYQSVHTPSIAGLAGERAALLYMSGTGMACWQQLYDGANWTNLGTIIQAQYPQLSVGRTTAYVLTSAPYGFATGITVQPNMYQKRSTRQSRAASSEIADISCHPVPAIDNATLHFTLSEESLVTITLFDALGRPIRTVRDMSCVRGTNHATLSVSDLESGMYFLAFDTVRGRRTVNLSVFH